MRSLSASARYRWAVFSRVAAAGVGGYALTALWVVLLALLWPLPRAEAVGAATMTGFLVYAVVVIWVFTARSALRAWFGVALACGGIALTNGWLLSGVGA